MFGIDKEKEATKGVAPGEAKGTEDEIQFDFEEDDKLPFDDEEDFGDEDLGEEPASGGLRQTLSQRKVQLLLGLLLLLAIGGGGYFYLSGKPAPPATPQAAVKAKVKVQVKAAAPATTPAPVTATKPASPIPVAVAPVKSSAAAPVAKNQPTSPISPVAAAPAKSPQALPATKEKTAPVAAVAPPAARSEAESSPAPLPFTLFAGVVFGQKEQREIEKKIHRLGYTPKVKTTYSMVAMTRLLLGVYDPATAKVRSKELGSQIPGFFSMKQGDKVALYAGSYQDLDQARSFADQLYVRGIHVDEEPVTLRMPSKEIRYGSFASRTSAEKAAKRAVAAGLSAQVVKR